MDVATKDCFKDFHEMTSTPCRNTMLVYDLHSGDLINVSNDIGFHISLKLKNQDKMFDALEISKDIVESQPIVFGGSNGIMER